MRRARRHAAFIAAPRAVPPHGFARDDVGREVDAIDDVVRRSRGVGAPFGLVPAVDEDGAATRGAPGRDVVEDVADHPAPFGDDAQHGQRATQHAGRGLRHTQSTV